MRHVLQPNECGIIQTEDVKMHSIRRRRYFIQRGEVKMRTPSEDNCHFTNREMSNLHSEDDGSPNVVSIAIHVRPQKGGRGEQGLSSEKSVTLFIFLRHTTIVGQTNQFTTTSKGERRRDKKGEDA